jgi:hypothetical protein
MQTETETETETEPTAKDETVCDCGKPYGALAFKSEFGTMCGQCLHEFTQRYYANDPVLKDTRPVWFDPDDIRTLMRPY